MSRYIDADKLIIEHAYPSDDWNRETDDYDLPVVAVSDIEDAPSIDLEADYVPREFHDKTCEAMAKRHQEEIADMVSVVRCKECKYYNIYLDEHGCWKRCDLTMVGAEADGFCSWGERKSDE